jgi:hypothetical protein
MNKNHVGRTFRPPLGMRLRVRLESQLAQVIASVINATPVASLLQVPRVVGG